MTADFKRGSGFTLAERGQLFGITAYLDGNGSGGSPDAQQAFRYVIYRDANGVPGAKVFESGNHYMRGGSAPMWISDVYPGERPTLDAGRYWLVILTGSPGGVARNFADGSGNWYGNSDAFSDGASAQFGAGATGNGTLSVFISYRPGTITTGEMGRTDVATAPSGGLTANLDRWSQFVLHDVGPTLTDLYAYLDGRGAATGSQKVRMALYGIVVTRDDEFFTKLAQSADVTISAGMPPQWVRFVVPPTVLNQTYPIYLIAIQSGDTAGVVRDYGDNRPDPSGNWGSVADPFADGAVDTIPVGTGPGVTLSVYAKYSLRAQ
jgi:hypothetical protein